MTTARAALLAALAAFAAPAAPAEKALILATTTSTQDSGLLDDLLPAFEKQTGYFVKTIAVGSGQAMAMGKRGEADVLLVHSPDDEKTFMAEGSGVDRRLVMHNDFVLVGPRSDPAHARGLATTEAAFLAIAKVGALFLSRGDNSGTHAKEKKIWKAAGLDPQKERWYQQTGLGMGDTLNVAAEKDGYTLADRATFLATRKSRPSDLEILVEKQPLLLNVYHVIRVNPDKWPKVNAAGAEAFADFMVAKATQERIGRFGLATVGAPLFVPDAGKDPAALGL